MSAGAASDGLRAWDSVPAGFRFPAFEVVIDTARQAHYHACCDVDAGPFGPYADVSILGQDTSIAVLRAGLPNDGRVQTRHRIRQHGPVRLGEALIIQGRVEPYGASARGRLLNCTFDFLRHDRGPAVTVEAEYLLPDGKAPAAAKTARPRPAADLADARPVAALRLTPDKVKAYSHEVGNLIHFDPAFAAARGFRAPLAQGLMQVTAMMGAIAADGPPAALDLEVRFRRPLFWDAAATLLRRGEAEYLCVTDDGRIAGEGVVHHLVR